MKNILIGNGINIQFDNKNYTTKSIVLRLLKNCDKDDFPRHIIVDYPYLMKNYLGKLFLEARAIIKGDYDLYAFGTVEKQSLIAFKERYASRLLTLKMTDIGFEDYYLVHDLVCHKTNTQNPDQWTIREAMKIAYLYAIYNDGKLGKMSYIYMDHFPKRVMFMLRLHLETNCQMRLYEISRLMRSIIIYIQMQYQRMLERTKNSN